MEKYLVIYSSSANDNNIYNHVIGGVEQFSIEKITF